MTFPVWKSINMKPLAATLGAGGITTAAEAEKTHETQDYAVYKRAEIRFWFKH